MDQDQSFTWSSVFGVCFLFLFCTVLLSMAISDLLSRRLNHTFPKYVRKMADTLMWENISMSIRGVDNSSPEAEVHVFVSNKVIKIEYVHVASTLEKTRYIDFCSIDGIRNSAMDSLTLALQLRGEEEVTFKFGTATLKGRFFEAITTESSDSRNTKNSNLGNSEESNSSVFIVPLLKILNHYCESEE